jgi:arsenate reductase
MIEVWGIPTCGTTRKALKLLADAGIAHTFRNYRETAPTKAMLKDALAAVDHPKKLFNTSGASYREGGWSAKAASITATEIVPILLADPMLIKRPIVRTDKGTTIGFDADKIMALVSP